MEVLLAGLDLFMVIQKGYILRLMARHKELKKKTFTVFLSSYRNTNGCLGEREMLWNHKLTDGQVFPQLF